MTEKKKILVVQPIHHVGIELLKNNNKFEYEILNDANLENIK